MDIIEVVIVTLLPAGFLIILFGGGALFQRKNIKQDGKAPINKILFYASKYSIVILWGAMVARCWGENLMVEIPARRTQLFVSLHVRPGD